MKRILGISFLLLIMPWLVNGAAIGQADKNSNQKKTIRFQDLPGEFRLQVISRAFPELVKFLTDYYVNRARTELPNLGNLLIYTFTTNRLNSQLVIFGFHLNGDDPDSLVIWDLKKNKMLHHQLIVHSGIPEHIIPDRNKIVFYRDYKASIWTMNPFVKFADLGHAYGTAMSHDGARIVTANHSTISAWDTETGKLIKSIPNVWGEVAMACDYLDMNQDGTKLALKAGGKKTINIIDLITGSTLLQIKTRGCAGKIRFSVDGTHLSAIVLQHGNQLYTVWDAASGKLVAERNLGEPFGKSDVQLVGKLRVENENHDWAFNVYNDATDLLLFTERRHLCNCIATDNWFVCTSETRDFEKKIHLWNLDSLIKQISTLNYDIGLLTDRQLLLLDRIRKMAEHTQKLKLNGDNDKLAGLIYEFGMLPDSIKEIVKNHVTFGAYE